MNIFRQCVFVGAVASGLNGGVLSSNFGPGDSFNSSLAFEVGNGGVTDWRIAVSFKPSETAYLGSIRFAADHRLFDNDYIVYIANDFGGNPGASIEAIYSVSFPPRPGIVTVKSATNPLLDATLTPCWSCWPMPRTLMASGTRTILDKMGSPIRTPRRVSPGSTEVSLHRSSRSPGFRNLRRSASWPQVWV